MNILYIAYSCSPSRGSEDKIGWNIPLESAKRNRVYVITKEEHRQDIEAYLRKNPIENVTFFYVDIPKVYKSLKGPLYSGRLNVWQKRAFSVAKAVCEEYAISIIHQITPIEIRAIGEYGKIPNVKFVCGPLGGGEVVPKGLRAYIKGHRFMEGIRAAANKWYQLRYALNRTLNHCDYVMFTNRETRSLVPQVDDDRCDIRTEIGLSEHELTGEGVTSQPKTPEEKPVFTFLVAGRMLYRKGHRFLVDVLKEMPADLQYQCRFVGIGPELEPMKALCKEYGLQDRVVFTGRVPFSEMATEYERADVFIMPSIREATGTVLLEAMSKGLPVVAINRFGSAVLVDETTGWLYDGNSRQEYIEALKKILIDCINRPAMVRERGQRAAEVARNHLWRNKIAFYQEKYLELIQKAEE